MKKMILIAAWAIVASWGLAQTAEEMMAEHMANRRVSLLEATQEDGSHFKYEATAQAVIKTPEWDGNSEPPLTLTKAISLATKDLKQKYPDFAEFELRGNRLDADLQWRHHEPVVLPPRIQREGSGE